MRFFNAFLLTDSFNETKITLYCVNRTSKGAGIDLLNIMEV